EIYTRAGNGEAMIDWLAHVGRLKAEQVRSYLYAHEDAAAVKHAFRVASGLDSMVIGEPQILGQLKYAVRIAEQEGTMGSLLSPLFQRTFAVAKEVRTNTDIGA